LGQVFVVAQQQAAQGLSKVFAAHEMMGLQDVRNAIIEAPGHPVALRRAETTDQTMLGGKRGAQSIKRMSTAGLPVTAKQKTTCLGCCFWSFS
jgi:hypothetical protein